MKKQILMLATVCAAACCLGACNNSGNQPSDLNEYDALNEMLNKSYSQVVLTVTNTFDENTSLTSEYIINYSESSITVHYTVEEFTKIDTSLDNPSTELKTTLTGVAVIIGNAVAVTGDDINIAADIVKPGLSFKEEYFENIELTDEYLKADVNNASAFLGSELTCADMKVEATFLEVFYEINVTYKSTNGNNVAYRYVFTL